MKKKSIVITLVVVIGMIFIASCGFVDAMTDEAKTQMEWADENGALGDGAGVSDDVKDIVYDLTDNDDQDIGDITNTATTVSDGDAHYLGDVVHMEWSDNAGHGTYDLAVVKYDRVYNTDGNAAIAVYYTVNNVAGDQLTFGNMYLTLYADSKYVESGYSGDYSPFSFGVLMPGTVYDGVYIANVDPNAVSDIMIYCGDVAWVLQEGSIPAETLGIATDYDVSWGAGFSGRYVLGAGSITISMYSSLDDEYVGNFNAILEDGSSYSGQIIWNSDACYYEGISEDGTHIELYFIDNGDFYTLDIQIQSDNGRVHWGSFEMVEHYES